MDEALVQLQRLREQQRDLEQRKEALQRALEELKLSNSFYFDHYDLAPVAYFTLSDTGLILQCNHAAAAVVGVSVKDLLGKWFARVLHERDRNKFQRLFSRLGETQQQLSGELRMEKGDGQTWVNLVCSARRKAGEIEVDIVLSDVTQRKLAELALMESQARLSAMIEWTPEAILVHRVGKILFVNPACIKMFGAASSPDLVGRQTYELIHPDFRDQQAGRMNSILQRVPIQPWVDSKFLRLDGTPFNVEVQGTAINYDGESAIHVCVRDISERRRTEDALEENREKYRALSEAAFEAVFISENGKCLEQNKRAQEMFGYTEEEALGQFGTRWIVPQDRERVMKNMLSGYELPYEVSGLRKDGSSFPATIRGRMMHYHGKTVRVTSMADITEIKRAEDALRLAASVFTHAREGISITDTGGTIIDVNDAFTRITGYGRDEVLGKNSRILQSGRHGKEFYQAMWSDLLEKGHWSGELWNRNKWGEEFVEKLTISAVHDESGSVRNYVALFSDVTQRRKMENKLENSENAIRMLFKLSPIGMAMVDHASGRFLEVNDSVLAATGYTEEEFLNLNFWDITPKEYEAQELEQIRELNENGRFGPNEKEYIRKDGSRYPISISGSSFTDANGRSVVWGVIEDISERKSAENKIRYLAFYDLLTNLPNRRLLHDRLRQTLAASRRHSWYGALMFLDLDNFKPLNDRRGHEAGDLLLKEVAKRLMACVRGVDSVARFGGDEFVVLLGEMGESAGDAAAQAGVVAEKIRTALAEPYLLTIQQDGAAGLEIEHRCSASIGVVMFGNDEASEDDILKWADAAMYQAKDAGRNAIRFHEAKGRR